MIRFVKKPDPLPLPASAEDNRFEQIRKAAVEQHKRSDADGTHRRARLTAEDYRRITPEKAASK